MPNVTDQISNLLCLPLVLGNDRVCVVSANRTFPRVPMSRSWLSACAAETAASEAASFSLASAETLQRTQRWGNLLQISPCADESPRHRPAIPGLVPETDAQHRTASPLRYGLRLLLVGAKARSLSSESAMNSRTDAATKKSLGPRKRELRVEVRKPLWPWATTAAKLETTRLRAPGCVFRTEIC